MHYIYERVFVWTFRYRHFRLGNEVLKFNIKFYRLPSQHDIQSALGQATAWPGVTSTIVCAMWNPTSLCRGPTGTRTLYTCAGSAIIERSIVPGVVGHGWRDSDGGDIFDARTQGILWIGSYSVIGITSPRYDVRECNGNAKPWRNCQAELDG
jgi:hypothetical protein